MSTYQTRCVLAGAYAGGVGRTRRSAQALLRHAVEVDASGQPLRVLCRRVRLDSLADHGATEPGEQPTCERCLAALRRRERWGA